MKLLQKRACFSWRGSSHTRTFTHSVTVNSQTEITATLKFLVANEKSTEAKLE